MLKDIIRSKQRNQIWIGMSLFVLGMAGLFSSMSYLGLFGTATNNTIEYNLHEFLKWIVALSFLLISMYGVGYIQSNRMGLKVAGGCALLLLGAWVVGYLGHKYTPSLQPFFGLIILFILMVYWKRHKK